MTRSRCALLYAFGTVAASTACGTSAPGGAKSAPEGAWSPAPALPVARFEAYAAVVRARVFFIGGITGVLGDIRTAQPSRRVDVFDPASGTWSDGPALPDDAPKHHLSVTVENDAIYVVGGFDGILGQRPNEPFRPVAVAYVLERDSVAWRRLAPPPLARGAATAQAIDGRIYVTGGAPNEGEPAFAQLDVYDIAHDAWSVRASLPTAREHLASCAIDGTMLVVGGWRDAPKTAQAVAERYDPRTDTWVTLPSMTNARGGLAATTVGATCHVVGGEDWALPLPGTFAAHEVFDATTGKWGIAAAMPTARHGLGLALVAGTLYAVGGGPSQGNSYTTVVEAFRP